jgi:hypothetical protein
MAARLLLAATAAPGLLLATTAAPALLLVATAAPATTGVPLAVTFLAPALLLLGTVWCRWRAVVGTPARWCGGDKGSGSHNLGFICQTQFLEGESIKRRSEGDVRCGGDEVSSGTVAGVDAAEDVEDECGVSNRLPDGAKGIGSSLHLLSIFFNKEISLSHGVELVTQEDDAGSLVRLEVSFDGDPKLVRCLFIFHGEIQDGVGDRAV